MDIELGGNREDGGEEKRCLPDSAKGVWQIDVDDWKEDETVINETAISSSSSI